jgi:hypothetical protein
MRKLDETGAAGEHTMLYSHHDLDQGGETGIGKMAAEKVWVPPAGRGARGGILNKPRRQMSFLSSSDSCELAPLRVCELACILCDVLCVSFWVMPRMLGKFPESFRLG